MNSPATVNLPQLSLHLEEQRRIFVSCNINHSISGPGGSPVQVSLWVPYLPHSSPPRLYPQALPDSTSHSPIYPASHKFLSQTASLPASTTLFTPRHQEHSTVQSYLS